MEPASAREFLLPFFGVFPAAPTNTGRERERETKTHFSPLAILGKLLNKLASLGSGLSLK